MIQAVKNQLSLLQKGTGKSSADHKKGEALFLNGNCQVLSQSNHSYDLVVTTEEDEDIEISIKGTGESLNYYRNTKKTDWDAYGIAAILQVEEELEKTNVKPKLQGKAYTREGMMKRVLAERKEKADKANYKIEFADNIYGEHTLINEKGVRYKITLRDFESETGYINNPDWRTNKLGTTKHIMVAFDKLKSKSKLYNKLSKTYPFVEIYLDPLNEYLISWHYPHKLHPDISQLIQKYFGKKNYIEDKTVKEFLLFIRDARAFPQIVIRPEVEEKVKKCLG